MLGTRVLGDYYSALELVVGVNIAVPEGLTKPRSHAALRGAAQFFSEILTQGAQPNALSDRKHDFDDIRLRSPTGISVR